MKKKLTVPTIVLFLSLNVMVLPARAGMMDDIGSMFGLQDLFTFLQNPTGAISSLYNKLYGYAYNNVVKSIPYLGEILNNVDMASVTGSNNIPIREALKNELQQQVTGALGGELPPQVDAMIDSAVDDTVMGVAIDGTLGESGQQSSRQLLEQSAQLSATSLQISEDAQTENISQNILRRGLVQTSLLTTSVGNLAVSSEKNAVNTATTAMGVKKLTEKSDRDDLRQKFNDHSLSTSAASLRMAMNQLVGGGK